LRRLSIFGIAKKYISQCNKLDSVSIQTSHISKIYCSFIQAAIPPNIIASFSNAGISIEFSQSIPGNLICKIDPSRARCIQEQFSEEFLNGFAHDS
jgi:hypothetical protein